MEDKNDLSVVAYALKALIKPEWTDLAKSLSKLILLKVIGDDEYSNQLINVISKAYSAIFTDEFTEFLKRQGIAYNESLINNLVLLGEYGWCCYSISSTNEDLSNAKLLNGLINFLKTNEDVTTKEIDEYISKYFTSVLYR